MVCLPDDLSEKVLQLMTSCGFATVQEFLETSLSGIVEDASKSEMVSCGGGPVWPPFPIVRILKKKNPVDLNLRSLSDIL